MDIEALKEQWSEVEDRDGVRLSWNVFPSSRMVGDTIHFFAGSYELIQSRKPRGSLSRLELSTLL
jgi:protein transport protein SEC23